jgi:acetyl coenzyme A synthetase (ADP forming)-like protein
MPSSLTPFFQPRGIAVVGANRRPGTIGWQIVDNLLRHGFEGAIFPVNPAARAIHSIPSWRSVREVPGDVDLALIVVPKHWVLDVVEDCAARGIRNVVVISAGFRETGPEGALREKKLVERVRALGMRLVGPNCMGLLNTDPGVAMNATFAPTMPPAGHVSFLSQSGALGVTILDYASEYGIGIRHFISVGNKPEVSGNDLLEFWETDPETRVILMYLETFGNPRKFTRIARRVSRKKPIIVVKSGRSRAGALAASSHTGALGGWDAAADALLAQCGVLRANSVEELFDLAMAFGTLPLPRGNRVAILTNAGGPGIMIADACEAEGLEVAEFTSETREGLRALFPEEASVRNPVDMIASATPESYEKALSLVLQDEAVDAVIAAFVPPLGVRQQQVAEAIIAGAQTRPDRPTLAVLMGREGLPTARPELRAAGIPAYIFPESAARALGALHRYARWVERPVQAPSRFAVDASTVTRILDAAARDGRTRLLETEGLAALSAYGIPVVPHTLATTPDEAVAAFHAMGGKPVVLKIVSPEVSHKTEIGGVLLDLRTEEEVRTGWTTLHERLRTRAPNASMVGILVTALQDGGREMILGMSLDPSFGPLLVFGLGGIYVETFRDVAMRVPPVTALEALEMISEIRSFPLLQGVRGEPAVPLEPVVESIQRLSQLVLDHDRIAGMDINPLLASEEGTMALDARILLQSSGSRGSTSSTP